MKVYRSSSAAKRGFAALLSVVSVLQLRTANSAPADIFSVPAPIDGAAPKPVEIKAGDATVSAQTGQVSWSYPITTPPGRQGMAPTLSLTYSSQAPVYGGIASGFAWNLGVPEIREDTSEGRIKTHPVIVGFQGDPKDDDRFVGLDGRRLVKVVEKTPPDVYAPYRAQGDDAFRRYERVATGRPYWRVRSMDGSSMEFGGTSAPCSNVSEGYAPLTRQLDAFGNEIKYTYAEVVPGECRLSTIEWGANGSAFDHFARVDLDWRTEWPGGPVGGMCNEVAVGSRIDYRSGAKIVTGASNLWKIRATAFSPGAPSAPVHTREISLDYSTQYMRCDQPHAPVRVLTSIQEWAEGTNAQRVYLPEVTLEYTSPAVTFPAPTAEPRPWGALNNPNNLAWGNRYAYGSTDQVDRTPTVEAMMVDMDGDGLLDRLVNTSSEPYDGACRAMWQKNLGPVSGNQVLFGGTKQIILPHLKWHGPVSDPPPAAGSAQADPYRGEKCSLAGQVTAFWNSNKATACHNGLPGGSACRAATNPSDQTLYCDPNGRECPPSQTAPMAPFTNLYYRWVDADGDGLTDLVAAVHGDIRRYDIEQGNNPLNSPPPAEPNIFGPWPACPTDVERCKDVDAGCVFSAIRSGDLSQIYTCIQSAPTTTCNSLSKAPDGAAGSINRGPYTRCEGLYPWFIFKNRGDGVLDSPLIKYQPVPLESDLGDSSFGPARGWTSQRHAIIDFDSDGILDAVVKEDGSPIWWVWFGDGTGGFEPKRHPFLGHSGAISESGIVPLASSGATAGILDMNGDGLPDYWQMISGQGNAMVWPNTGTEHSTTQTIVTPYNGSFGVKPGNDTVHDIPPDGYRHVQPPGQAGRWTYFKGSTYAQARVFDLDHDGRVDVVYPNPIEGPPSVAFNLGGQLNSTTQVNTNAQGLLRKTRIDGQLDVADGTWELLSDQVDLDGDGVAELVDFESGTYQRARQTNTEPPRMLKKVHNGRGAHTTIAYAPLHDASTVTQSTTSSWLDRWGRSHPNASPRAQWVAKSVTSTDDFSNTTSTTSYFYKDPRFGPDDSGTYAFRGFGEVTTTNPSGSKTMNRYAYDTDWSGRLVETIVKPSDAESNVPGEVRSIERVQWTARTLFNNAIETYHVTRTEAFACGNEQDEAACNASPAGYTRTDTTQTALASSLGGSTPLLWMNTVIDLRGGPPPGDPATLRKTTQTFRVQADASNYRVRPLVTTREYSEGGTLKLFAKSEQTWDPAYYAPATEEVWVNTNAAEKAITHFEYDLTTGNLKKRWKPKQWATNKFTAYTYDTRGLFVATEVNELGQRTDNGWEYGTGTQTLTEGPNQRTCVTGTGCPLDATHPLKEQHKTVVDGLGRTIESWDTVSDDGALYELWQRSTTSYVDTTAGGSHPLSMTQRVRLSTTSPTWTEDETQLDGHGRAIKKTSFAQGSAPANHVTMYGYRNDGTLATVQVPDPSQNSTARVTYSYAFDSLGRLTSIRRPDANQSGLGVSYLGTAVITQEWLPIGSGGGEASSTLTLHDDFGRVAQVWEFTNLTPPIPTYETTSYTYGPDDNVIKVVDPEGVTTEMAHDFAGHRTEIKRYGRVWKYGYDANGNVTSEMVPGSPNPPVTDLDYTTTIAYDDLDRPTSKVIGQRSLSTADRALFANRTETFSWDVGGNMIGSLRYWRSFAPGASTFAVEESTRFDNQDNLVTSIQALRVAGLPNLERRFERRYHLFGGVAETRYNDQVGGTNKTISTTQYDARGLPAQMVLKRTGVADQTVAVQTRNAAGLVTKRRTEGNAPIPFVESNWTYDPLGRITSQVVQKGPTATQVVRQDMTYEANDNPKTLTHYLGTNAKQLNFTYDNKHQLKTVSSVTPGYFNAVYDYSKAGRLNRVTQSQTISPLPANGEVKSRDVNYVYGDSDPERLTALTNASNGSTYAGYTYDAAGNMTRRCYGGSGTPSCAGESTEYVYDGKDQLRRATKKVGGVTVGSEEYWYDGSGHRVAVLKRNASNAKTELIWFLGDTEAHYDGAGALKRVYSHLSLGTPVARVERTANATTSVEYQFHGLGGSTIAAIAQDGTVNASFSYAPFGEVIEGTDAGGASGITSHLRRFNDKFKDDISGLSYYGARYYDATSMTWTQSDPLYRFAPDAAWTEPRRALLYSFTLNNPLRYMDPDGRDPKGIPVLVRNLTGDKFASTSKEIAADIQEDFTSKDGIFGSYLNQIDVSAKVAITQSSNPAKGSNRMDIILVNLLDQDSIDAAVKAGGSQAENAIDGLNNDKDELARSGVNGTVTVIAVNRVAAKEKSAKASTEERKRYHKEIGAHEAGHLVGNCHNKTASAGCKDDKDKKKAEKDKRKKDEVMSGGTSLASEVYKKFWSQADVANGRQRY